MTRLFNLRSDGLSERYPQRSRVRDVQVADLVGFIGDRIFVGGGVVREVGDSLEELVVLAAVPVESKQQCASLR